ncbi:ABC-2 type transport system permease protein [Frankineae bacterium MT45]|nr:ABC-2 type transport system permease protein [Frankineae bacterium MT45]
MTALVEATPVRRTRAPGTGAVLLWELEKLAAQWRTRLAFVVCLVGPFAFAGAMRVSQSLPSDTLFGRWIHDSGFAVPLVVLGFAGAWALPLLVAIVAGDIFSTEDHLGTWPLLLTRSVRPMTIYVAKLLAVACYSVAMISILAVSSTAAGLLVEGAHPLVTLSGGTVTGAGALSKIALSWASVLLPSLAFAAFATSVSVLTRNSLAGIIGPTVVGLLLQLLLMLESISVIRDALPSTTFIAWHGYFMDPQALGSLHRGEVWSAVYLVAFCAVTLTVLARRDETNR